MYMRSWAEIIAFDLHKEVFRLYTIPGRSVSDILEFGGDAVMVFKSDDGSALRLFVLNDVCGEVFWTKLLDLEFGDNIRRVIRSLATAKFVTENDNEAKKYALRFHGDGRGTVIKYTQSLVSLQGFQRQVEIHDIQSVIGQDFVPNNVDMGMYNVLLSDMEMHQINVVKMVDIAKACPRQACCLYTTKNFGRGFGSVVEEAEKARYNQKGSTKDVSFKAVSKKKVNVFDENITLLLQKFHSEWREDIQKESTGSGQGSRYLQCIDAGNHRTLLWIDWIILPGIFVSASFKRIDTSQTYRHPFSACSPVPCMVGTFNYGDFQSSWPILCDCLDNEGDCHTRRYRIKPAATVSLLNRHTYHGSHASPNNRTNSEDVCAKGNGPDLDITILVPVWNKLVFHVQNLLPNSLVSEKSVPGVKNLMTSFNFVGEDRSLGQKETAGHYQYTEHDETDSKAEMPDILTKRRNSTGMSDLELTEFGIQNFALSG
ncbi:hypothetical protein ACET3Z_030735 [Daucus carota]